MIFDTEIMEKWVETMKKSDPQFMKSWDHYNELWGLIMERARTMATDDPIALYIFGLSMQAFSEQIFTKYFKLMGMSKQDAYLMTEQLKSVAQLFGEQIMMQIEEK